MNMFVMYSITKSVIMLRCTLPARQAHSLGHSKCQQRHWEILIPFLNTTIEQYNVHPNHKRNCHSDVAKGKAATAYYAFVTGGQEQ